MADKDGLKAEDNKLISDMAHGQEPDVQILNGVFNNAGKSVLMFTIRQIAKYNKR